MRYFVPASDDELYKMIERYGFAALVPYRAGLKLQHADTPHQAPPPSVPIERRAA